MMLCVMLELVKLLWLICITLYCSKVYIVFVWLHHSSGVSGHLHSLPLWIDFSRVLVFVVLSMVLSDIFLWSLPASLMSAFWSSFECPGKSASFYHPEQLQVWVWAFYLPLDLLLSLYHVLLLLQHCIVLSLLLWEIPSMVCIVWCQL